MKSTNGKIQYGDRISAKFNEFEKQISSAKDFKSIERLAKKYDLKIKNMKLLIILN